MKSSILSISCFLFLSAVHSSGIAQDVSITLTPTCANQSNGVIEITVLTEDYAPPFTFTWTDAAGNPLPAGQIIQDVVLGTSTAHDLAAGSYCLEVVSADGCSASSCDLVVEGIPAPVLENMVATCICPNGTATAGAAASGGTPPYAFHWQGPAGSGYQSYEQYPNDISVPGEYTVVVTDNSGCNAEVSVVVEMCQNSTVVTPGPVNCICPGGYGSIEIEVEGDDGPYQFVWHAPNGLDIFTVQNPTLLTETGDYTLVVTGSSGCNSVLTVNVPAATEILPSPQTSPTGTATGCGMAVSVKPNPFSSELVITATGLRQGYAGIGIFNTFGQEIWRREADTESDRAQFVWAPLKGLPPGVYYVHVVDEEGCRAVVRAVYSP